jgi:predicted ester cyclase
MTRSDIEKLVRRWADEAVAAGRLEVFDELLAEDVRDVGPAGVTVGREPFKARAGAVYRAFSERTVSVDALVVEGDSVAWRWTLRGVHSGPFLDLAPTGRAVVLSGANFQRVREARVVEHWTLADTAGLLRQLR